MYCTCHRKLGHFGRGLILAFLAPVMKVTPGKYPFVLLLGDSAGFFLWFIDVS